MLVAHIRGQRIEAQFAIRGNDFTCPLCARELILKQGPKVIWHFAHKPPTDCSAARGETIAHLNAKKLIRDAFAARGLRADLEYIVNGLPGDRRADVMVWSPSGVQIAIEIQQTPISIEEIQRRASCYAKMNIAQIWISLTNLDDAKKGYIERYSARPFERWIHGFNGKNEIWMMNKSDLLLHLGKFSTHWINVEEKSWYDSYGNEQWAGPYSYESTRWCELTLKGPYQIGDLKFHYRPRQAFRTKDYSWPACSVAFFIPQQQQSIIGRM